MALGDGTFSGIGVLPTWEQINSGLASDDTTRRMYEQAMAQALQTPVQWNQAQQMTNANVAPQAAPPPEPIRARELFINRMKGIRATGFFIKRNDFLECHVYDDKVYMFYMFNGKEGVVSEPIDAFPSDQLIAQFRMVLA